MTSRNSGGTFRALQQSPRRLHTAPVRAATPHCGPRAQAPCSDRAGGQSVAALLFGTQSTEASEGLTPDVLDLDELTQWIVLPHPQLHSLRCSKSKIHYFLRSGVSRCHLLSVSSVETPWSQRTRDYSANRYKPLSRRTSRFNWYFWVLFLWLACYSQGLLRV